MYCWKSTHVTMAAGSAHDIIDTLRICVYRDNICILQGSRGNPARTRRSLLLLGCSLISMNPVAANRLCAHTGYIQRGTMPHFVKYDCFYVALQLYILKFGMWKCASICSSACNRCA
jgi:hypothetical protein